MKIWGLVPARQGSVRVPRKNLRFIDVGEGEQTLVEIAVEQAQRSGIFERVICSSESPEILGLARFLGAEGVLRPTEYATPTSPDLEWVQHALLGQVVPEDLRRVEVVNPPCEAFAILRPTSPFRTAQTIRRAFEQFQGGNWDSIRAVQPVSERPEKMWVMGSIQRKEGGWLAGSIQPYLNVLTERFEHHRVVGRLYEEQSAIFPDLWVQNGCLEMAWTRVLPNSISGDRVGMFLTEGLEGIDINTEEDLLYAQWLASRRRNAKGLGFGQ